MADLRTAFQDLRSSTTRIAENVAHPVVSVVRSSFALTLFLRLPETPQNPVPALLRSDGSPWMPKRPQTRRSDALSIRRPRRPAATAPWEAVETPLRPRRVDLATPMAV
jgi:hypothetical protein